MVNNPPTHYLASLEGDPWHHITITALCGRDWPNRIHNSPYIGVTIIPDQVTCEKCLEAMKKLNTKDTPENE